MHCLYWVQICGCLTSNCWTSNKKKRLSLMSVLASWGKECIILCWLSITSDKNCDPHSKNLGTVHCSDGPKFLSPQVWKMSHWTESPFLQQPAIPKTKAPLLQTPDSPQMHTLQLDNLVARGNVGHWHFCKPHMLHLYIIVQWTRWNLTFFQQCCG